MLTHFLGDIFIYLKKRGTPQDPGEIVRDVAAPLLAARQNSPDEPLVVITHSMGGNILYDILTHFLPDLKVDFWISAGAQVGQFEEMKIFVDSDESIGAPTTLETLKGRVGAWFNVYDPADILSFLAEPVFGGNAAPGDRDILFNSGADAFQAHGTYFKRPSFYELIRQRMEGFLK